MCSDDIAPLIMRQTQIGLSRDLSCLVAWFEIVSLANGGLSILVEIFWLTDSQNNITKSVTMGWYLN